MPIPKYLGIVCALLPSLLILFCAAQQTQGTASIYDSAIIKLTLDCLVDICSVCRCNSHSIDCRNREVPRQTCIRRETSPTLFLFAHIEWCILHCLISSTGSQPRLGCISFRSTSLHLELSGQETCKSLVNSPIRLIPISTTIFDPDVISLTSAASLAEELVNGFAAGHYGDVSPLIPPRRLGSKATPYFVSDSHISFELPLSALYDILVCPSLHSDLSFFSFYKPIYSLASRCCSYSP